MEGWVSKGERGEYGIKNASVQDGGLFLLSSARFAGTQALVILVSLSITDFYNS